MNPRALILLHPGFEEIEAITPIDLLSRANIEVVQAAVGEDLLVTGRSGITVKATHSLTAVAEETFDAVILPGGPGIQQLRKHPLICALFQRQRSADRLIGCICAAPLLLLDAGLLSDIRYTCYPGVKDELSEALDDSVVQDGSIITSRGAGTATEFGLCLVGALTNKATANEIAESICWNGKAGLFH